MTKPGGLTIGVLLLVVASICALMPVFLDGISTNGALSIAAVFTLLGVVMLFIGSRGRAAASAEEKHILTVFKSPVFWVGVAAFVAASALREAAGSFTATALALTGIGLVGGVVAKKT